MTTGEKRGTAVMPLVMCLMGMIVVGAYSDTAIPMVGAGIPLEGNQRRWFVGRGSAVMSENLFSVRSFIAISRTLGQARLPDVRMLTMLLLPVIFSGCTIVPYPHRVSDFPEVRGRVVYRDSNEPVKNLTVTSSKYHEPLDRRHMPTNEASLKRPEVSRTAVTSDDGSFRFEAEEHWQSAGPIALPFDILLRRSELRLSYSPKTGESPMKFRCPYTQSFGNKLVYYPSLASIRDARYGPFDFGELEIEPPSPKSKE